MQNVKSIFGAFCWCACVVQITIKGVIFVCAGRCVCVFLSVKFVFIPNIIEVHPSIVSYRRGRGGWLMICGDFYNKHCFKIHTEVAMTPYCFSSTVCLSVQHCRCLFMSMCTCVCALWILLLVSFIILILQSLQWPLNLLFSAFRHLFLFYLLSFWTLCFVIPLFA